MALLRRAPELEQSVQQQQRPRIIHMLRNALYRGVPTAAGWLCLAELCRKEGLAAEALSAARQVSAPPLPGTAPRVLAVHAMRSS